MLKRFAAWLAAKAGVSPTIDAVRIKGGTDAVERGMRWEQFYREDGGLRDMLAALRREAFEAAQEAEVGDDQTRLAWMLQDRAYRALQGRIEAVVISGKVELDRRQHTEREAAARKLRATEF
jgi:hypothetical protein